jgi:hypothetical protein
LPDRRDIVFWSLQAHRPILVNDGTNWIYSYRRDRVGRFPQLAIWEDFRNWLIQGA